MLDAVPEPIYPEADAYPACREPMPIEHFVPKRRSPIDEYVIAAVIATGTRLVGPKIFARKSTEF